MIDQLAYYVPNSMTNYEMNIPFVNDSHAIRYSISTCMFNNSSLMGTLSSLFQYVT